MYLQKLSGNFVFFLCALCIDETDDGDIIDPLQVLETGSTVACEVDNFVKVLTLYLISALSLHKIE